jgi:hypothetical protein
MNTELLFHLLQCFVPSQFSVHYSWIVLLALYFCFKISTFLDTCTLLHWIYFIICCKEISMLFGKMTLSQMKEVNMLVETGRLSVHGYATHCQSILGNIGCLLFLKRNRTAEVYLNINKSKENSALGFDTIAGRSCMYTYRVLRWDVACINGRSIRCCGRS